MAQDHLELDEVATSLLSWSPRLPAATQPPHLKLGLLFWLFKGGFKVSLGTVEWYISSYDTEFDKSEIARPVK